MAQKITPGDFDMGEFYESQRRRAALLQTLHRSDSISKFANDKVRESHVLEDIVRERFETGGASSGEPWAPLKASTLRAKRARGQPPTPLVATGQLAEAAIQGEETSTATEVTKELQETGPSTAHADVINASRPFYGPLGPDERDKFEEVRKNAVEARISDIHHGKARNI